MPNRRTLAWRRTEQFLCALSPEGVVEQLTVAVDLDELYNRGEPIHYEQFFMRIRDHLDGRDPERLHNVLDLMIAHSNPALRAAAAQLLPAFLKPRAEFALAFWRLLLTDKEQFVRRHAMGKLYLALAMLSNVKRLSRDQQRLKALGREFRVGPGA